MKYLFSLFIVLWTGAVLGQNTSIEPCPRSPNCVSTVQTTGFKKMDPIKFNGEATEIIVQLEEFMKQFDNARLIEQSNYYFHYVFETAIGNFKDDVEFLINPETKTIDFRSASRTGYGDFGKNKRRMKKIRKAWYKKYSGG